MKQLWLPLPSELPDQLPVPADVRPRLERVLRLRPGAELRLADGDGRRVLARWQGATFELVEPPTVAPPPRLTIELGVGLLKGERWDWLLEKATELGVDRVVPLQLQHCVVRADGHKTSRWQAICTEAFEQCGRDRRPEVTPPQTLTAWLRGLERGPLLWADERARDAAHLLTVAREATGRLAVLVGPEGGLSEAERTQVTGAGGRPITLGPDVLRAETAAIMAVAWSAAARQACG